jgi:predicted RNA-binding Zn-ribbon protein involved in translation (DUF1610 family)
MSDWWTKKLAGEKPSVDRTGLPPVNVPMRFGDITVTPQNPQPVQPRTENLPPPESLSEALQRGHSNGGEAARNAMNCPDCGSGNVFNRSKGNTLNGASPAPRCYECGWNGLYDQGQQGSWG